MPWLHYCHLHCTQHRWSAEHLQYIVLQAGGVEGHGVAEHICWEGGAALAINGQATNRDGPVAQAAEVHLHLMQHLVVLRTRLQRAQSHSGT